MKRVKLDPRLTATLHAFAAGYIKKREAAFAGLDFEALRDRLATVRDQALARQEELLDRFEQQARRHGSVVMRAEDGAAANRQILEIMQRHGVRRLAKSKSMVSEETRLNDFLLAHGMEPRETDLGEWIIQLAGEPPTHMVMPAIHLDRHRVAGIFSAYLGRQVPADIPALVHIAREELRKEIFETGAGLTGANALIAENGSILLVTNEGNGRLVTTVPPVHIVLASTEKIAATLADAFLLLKVLPKSATGQVITSYASFIAGPHREAQYIILLDNHRSELLAEPRFATTLRCIKCSACLNVCPVYLQAGGREYAHIYMGGIGTLLTAWIHGLRQSRELAGLCAGCHRCEAVCSTKIPIPDLIVALKERLNEELGKSAWKRLALDGILGKPAFRRAALGAARSCRPLLTRKGFLRRLPPGLRRHDRFRALPAPAPEPFSRLLARHRADSRPAENALTGKPRLQLFAGCLIEHCYPRIGMAAVEVLEHCGYTVSAGPDRCCGFPAANAGHTRTALHAYQALLAELDPAVPVVTLCPTCHHLLARSGPELLAEKEKTDAAQREKARQVAAATVTFAGLLAARHPEVAAGLKPAAGHGVTYHDSCHHRHVLAAHQDSRTLLRRALGRELTEMENADSCCGFAGTFSVDHPEISAALLAEKVEAIRKSGAGTVALDCPGCLLQIQGGLQRQGVSVEVRHTAEILCNRLEEKLLRLST